MSWEGFIQCWCRNGHHFSPDPYGYYDEYVCPKCGMKSVFTHTVNQTNCDGIYLEPIRLYGDIYEIPTEDDVKRATEKHLKICDKC